MNKKIVALLSTAVVFSTLAVDKPVSLDYLTENDSYIVELNDKPLALDKGGSYSNLIKNQNKVISQIKILSSAKINEKEITHFTQSINGFCIKLDSDDVNRIKQLPEVKNIYNNTKHQMLSVDTSDINEASATVHKNYSIGTMNRPDVENPGKDVLVSVLDDGFFIDNSGEKTIYHEAYSDNLNGNVGKYTESYFTEKKSQEGFIGKEADRLNDKVPYFFDYGGSSLTKKNDTNVYYKDASHGTHVSTSIAGKSSSYEGVAPYAQLSLMKVAQDGSGAYDADILEAIEDSVRLGADVISMSMGSPINEFNKNSQGDSVIDTIFETMNQAGIIFNVAAGNNGKETFRLYDDYKYDTPTFAQNGDVGSYACDDRLMVVANTYNDFYIGTGIEFNGNVYVFSDTSNESLSFKKLFSAENNKSYDYVLVPGLGKETDYANIDVSGKVAIVQRGETEFGQKISIAQNNGAIGCLVYDNVDSDTMISMNVDTYPGITIPCGFIKKSAYADIVADEDQKLKVLVDSPVNESMKRRINPSSSSGTTSSLSIKPDISSPGTAVTAGVINLGVNDKPYSGYADYTGTSMATPNYSGALAVLLSQGVAKESLIMKTMSTADPMVDSRGVYYSPRRQGAGLINIGDALNTKAYLEGSDTRGLIAEYSNVTKPSTSKIELGYSTTGEFTLNFKIHNESAAAETYTPTVSVMIPRTVDTANELDQYGNEREVEKDGSTYMTVYDNEIRKFSSAPITVAGNSSQVVSIELNLTAEEKSNIEKIFKYEDGAVSGTYVEGYVVLKPENAYLETLNIPYLGFYGDFTSTRLVEPFNFEKKEGVIYQSSLLNSAIKTISDSNSFGLNADYSSQIILGAGTAKSIDSVLNNTASLSSLGKPMGYNEATGKYEYEDNTFYVGGTSASDVMYIQQFVLGTVATNSLKLYNSTGSLIIDDHMFSALYSGLWMNDDDSHTPNSYRLNRSIFNIDMIGEKNYIADRAYSIIPLYPYRETANGFVKTGSYKDGEYKMVFDYTSEASLRFGKSTLENPASNQHMEYKLIFDSVKPQIKDVRIVVKDGVQYLKVVATDNNSLLYASANGKVNADFVEDTETGETSAMFKISELTSAKWKIRVFDRAYNSSSLDVNYNELIRELNTYSSADGTYRVISSDINQDVIVDVQVSDSEYGKTYTLVFKSNGEAFESSVSFELILKEDASGINLESSSIYYYDANGKLVEAEVVLADGEITVTVPDGSQTKVIVVDFSYLVDVVTTTNKLTGLTSYQTSLRTKFHKIIG